MANENPEISQKRTLLRADLSDQQSQELLKQIQRRANLPYDYSMDKMEQMIDKAAANEQAAVQDAFDLEMGPRLEREMTPEAKAMLDEFRARDSKRIIIREKMKANNGIGLPTI